MHTPNSLPRRFPGECAREGWSRGGQEAACLQGDTLQLDPMLVGKKNELPCHCNSVACVPRPPQPRTGNEKQKERQNHRQSTAPIVGCGPELVRAPCHLMRELLVCCGNGPHSPLPHLIPTGVFSGSNVHPFGSRRDSVANRSMHACIPRPARSATISTSMRSMWRTPADRRCPSPSPLGHSHHTRAHHSWGSLSLRGETPPPPLLRVLPYRRHPIPTTVSPRSPSQHGHGGAPPPGIRYPSTGSPASQH